MEPKFNVGDLFNDDGDPTMHKIVRILEESFKYAYRDGFNTAVITEGQHCNPETAWQDFKARVNADSQLRKAA